MLDFTETRVISLGEDFVAKIRDCRKNHDFT